MSDAVEIWFRIEKDADGFPESQEWEQLYAWPVKEGFQVDNIPFFVKEIAVGDVVSASRMDAGWYRFDEIILPGDHSTFRIWLSSGLELTAHQILTELRDFGCQAELTLDRLIAIDVKPEQEPKVWELLVEGRDRGDWDFQVGCSRD